MDLEHLIKLAKLLATNSKNDVFNSNDKVIQIVYSSWSDYLAVFYGVLNPKLVLKKEDGVITETDSTVKAWKYKLVEEAKKRKITA